jgi:cyclophilin family peptidyl-prolyl cis-trans isomerase
MLSLQTVKAQTKVMFYTTMGNFEAELYDGLQPITSNNFKSLANAKFYDGIIFHRVINGFMIQGGDPTGTGSGGPGYTITDEFDPNTSNIQKTLAMANAGPNTGGSQFFINLVNNTYLNPNHPVFGIVTTNFSVVQSIGAVAVNASDRPLTDVKMDSVRVIAFPLSTTSLNANSLVGIESNAEQLVNLSLYNIQGILMQKSTVYVPKGASKLVIKNILPNSISNGNYVLIAETKTSVMKYKFDLLK